MNHHEDIDTDLLELGKAVFRPQRYAVSRKGMISSQHYLATEAGKSILSYGGNAIDAAVAAAFALGVVEPAASGLGGQTMIMYYDVASGRRIAFDGSSRAPSRITPGILPKPYRLRGHMATTVPSTPAVLAYTLDRYGTLSLKEVLEPAIELAEHGYRVSELQYKLARRELKRLRAGTAATFFLRHGQNPYRIGQHFRQPTLAATLRRLAEAGVEDFYHGDISRRIVQDMEKNGGAIRADDLALIPWPVERKPLTTKFGKHRIYTFAEPGSGRVLIETLNILRELPQQLLNPDTPKGAFMLAETLRQANIDRSDRPFDPNIHPQETSERMMRSEYAQKVSRRIYKRIKTHGDTTHLSAMDSEGNIVALTQSIERVYGSFAASPDLGFLYNNYMSAFEYEDITHPYYLRPNGVPWASVAPTLVFRNNRPWLSIGSPGSERIVSAVVQVLLRLFHGESPFDAVDAPRLHCSVKGRVSLELSRMRNDIATLLDSKGFTIDEREPYSFYLGCVQMVLKQRGELIGIADPRRDGAAGGP